MAREQQYLKAVINMSVITVRANFMAKELILGQMEINMLVYMRMEIRVAKEFQPGLMAINM